MARLVDERRARYRTVRRVRPAVLAAAILLSATSSADAAPVVHGAASWYVWHAGQAAAGPRLRAMLGAHWRGALVDVIAANGRRVRVRLTDWCSCGSGRVIDLDRRSFAALTSPLAGVVRVTVRRP